MLVLDYNIFIGLIWIFLFGLLFNMNSFLHMLLLAELLWVTLYGLVWVGGLVLSDLNLMTLTFILLVFSALELGIGLELLSIYQLIMRSLAPTSLGNVHRGFRYSALLYGGRRNWRL